MFSLQKQKPKLTSSDLIAKMKNEQGITFNYISEQKAIAFLENSNNYLRTASYRKNYQKHKKGVNKGKYIHLDFLHLKELSTIDMHLRFIIMKMCVDLEHSLKVSLLKDFENNNDSGYDFVKTFLLQNNYLLNIIYRNKFSSYTTNLMHKYFTIDEENKIINDFSNCPIWVLLEFLSFGDFIRCYVFYYSTYNQNHIDRDILYLIKNLRNACAHNNCIINDLQQKANRPPYEISTFIASIKTIGTQERKNKLKCKPVLEFVSLIYLYNNCVSKKVKESRMTELNILFKNRILSNKNLFAKNELIVSHGFFIKKVLDFYSST